VHPLHVLRVHHAGARVWHHLRQRNAGLVRRDGGAALDWDLRPHLRLLLGPGAHHPGHDRP
jgi:hypothetical protein